MVLSPRPRQALRPTHPPLHAPTSPGWMAHVHGGLESPCAHNNAATAAPTAHSGSQCTTVTAAAVRREDTRLSSLGGRILRQLVCREALSNELHCLREVVTDVHELQLLSRGLDDPFACATFGRDEPFRWIRPARALALRNGNERCAAVLEQLGGPPHASKSDATARRAIVLARLLLADR